MATPAKPSKFPPKIPGYDWKKELGELPKPVRLKSGQSGNAHPMTVAYLRLGEIYKARAKRIMRQLLRNAEGSLDEIADALGCSWHVAQRLVKAMELSNYAGELRAEFGRRGPFGPFDVTQPKKRIRTATS
jgi:hypothetical protein